MIYERGAICCRVIGAGLYVACCGGVEMAEYVIAAICRYAAICLYALRDAAAAERRDAKTLRSDAALWRCRRAVRLLSEDGVMRRCASMRWRAAI